MADQVEHPPVLVFPPRLKAEPLEERPRSPETNCAICLEEFNNKSYTNSCFHEFCYHCLKEWSKIKPECPLCKQRFQTIIYNIRSQQEYDEYHVGNSPDIEVVSQWFNQAFQRPSLFRYRNTLDFRRLLIDEREFFFMPAAAAHSPPLPGPQPPPSLSIVDSQTFEHDFGSTLTLNGTRNRRDVYRHDRWVRPSASNRVRESSPEFYRWNPAQTHRLIPWLSRELNVLLDVSVDPQVLCQEILNLITTYPIRSREFRDALRPALGERVNHFVHEFYHFAISPHDIVTYDVIAEYGGPGVHTYNFSDGVSSDSDSDIEVVTITGAPLLTNMSLRQVDGNCLDLTSRAGPSNAPTCLDPPIVIEISSDTDTSDSEIEIIEVPPVEPEIVIIDSTSEDEQHDTQTLPSQVTKCESPDGHSSGLQSEALTSLRSSYHTISDSDVEVGVDENSSSHSATPKVHSEVLSPSTSYLQSCSDSPEYSVRFNNSSPAVESLSTNLSSATTTSSSSSTTTTTDTTDSDGSEYIRKRIKHVKRRKRISSSSRRLQDRKRLKCVYNRIKSPVSSSDEDYVYVPIARASRSCRLKSVVVKPDRKNS